MNKKWPVHWRIYTSRNFSKLISSLLYSRPIFVVTWYNVLCVNSTLSSQISVFKYDSAYWHHCACRRLSTISVARDTVSEHWPKYVTWKPILMTYLSSWLDIFYANRTSHYNQSTKTGWLNVRSRPWLPDCHVLHHFIVVMKVHKSHNSVHHGSR